jgi:hypothetical protein
MNLWKCRIRIIMIKWVKYGKIFKVFMLHLEENKKYYFRMYFNNNQFNLNNNKIFLKSFNNFLLINNKSKWQFNKCCNNRVNIKLNLNKQLHKQNKKFY